MDPFVEVYVAASVPDAYVLKAALEGAGLTVRVTNEYLEGALGGIPLDSTLPQVLVPRSQVEQAMQILTDMEAQRGGEGEEEEWGEGPLGPDEGPEGPEGHVD
jgi:hypothetical protein